MTAGSFFIDTFKVKTPTLGFHGYRKPGRVVWWWIATFTTDVVVKAFT